MVIKAVVLLKPSPLCCSAEHHWKVHHICSVTAHCFRCLASPPSSAPLTRLHWSSPIKSSGSTGSYFLRHPHEHLQKSGFMHISCKISLTRTRALQAGAQGHQRRRREARQKCTSCAESYLLVRKRNAKKVVLVPQDPLYFARPRFSKRETYRRGLEDMMLQ